MWVDFTSIGLASGLPLAVNPIVSFGETVLTGLLNGGVYAIISMGLTLIFGVMGFINFAQADFMTWGMYVTFVLFGAFTISPLIIFFLIFPLFIVAGAMVERGLAQWVYDAQEESQMILTFGWLLVLQNVALAVFGPNAQSIRVPYSNTAFEIGPFLLNQARSIAFVFSLAAAAALFAFLKYTEFGRAIRATADNRQVARYAGIDVGRVYMVAFGIGIALTASAGALLVMYTPVSPTTGFDFILLMFVVTILGGLGSVKGALIAGLAIGVIEQVAIIWLPLQMQASIAFALFLIVVLIRPQGLYGTKVREV